MSEPPAAGPRPSLALAVVPITLVVTAVARSIDRSAHIQPGLVYGLAAGGAALIGVPLLVWSFDSGRLRAGPLITLGALAGALPLLLVLLSGVLGRFITGGGSLDYVRWFLGIGAPVPLVGAVPWAEFAMTEIEALLIGAVSGGLVRVVVRRPL
jgi:hypothetical protein